MYHGEGEVSALYARGEGIRCLGEYLGKFGRLSLTNAAW